MDDRLLLALCISSEASGEPLAGKQAVARVILNRARALYQSDGSIKGTVLHPCAFSGFWYQFQGDSYVRVCKTLADAEAKAERMLIAAEAQPSWPACVSVASATLAGTLPPAPDLEQALLYLNPAIVRHQPAWAVSEKECCTVGRHVFFRA